MMMEVIAKNKINQIFWTCSYWILMVQFHLCRCNEMYRRQNYDVKMAGFCTGLVTLIVKSTHKYYKFLHSFILTLI